MKLSILDVSIVVCYLISIILIGWFLRKKARQSKENYLLGGKTIPWYIAGVKQCFRYVRYQRHHVAGGGFMYDLWPEKYLDTLALACF